MEKTDMELNLFWRVYNALKKQKNNNKQTKKQTEFDNVVHLWSKQKCAVFKW